MEENNQISCDTNSIIDIFEKKLYSGNTFISTKDVINKVTEFSNFFNSTGRIALLNADPQECQELVHLFFALKKNIKSAISEMGRSNAKKVQNFSFPECDDNIEITPGADVWNILQDHTHFERLFINALTGNLKVIPIQSDSSDEPEASNLNNGNINNDPTDSGIEQCEEPDVQTPEEAPLGDNSFRFNFELKYDPIVANVLYPESFISMNKYDRCPYISVQKSSRFRAVCLLCCCDLISTKNISKKQCLDHILGQRHMKSSANPANVENLKNYHEIFWNLDISFQAHQVYFEPHNNSSLLCKLCNALIPNKYIVEHILGDFHKNIVIKMFNQKCSDFYLLNVQVGAYGIEEKVVESPNKEKTEPKSETKTEKRRSTSSTSKDNPDVEHIIVPSVVNSGKNAIQDFLPRRFHGHAKYFIDKVTYCTCVVCKINVNKDVNSLKRHIFNVSHLQLTDVKLPKFTYYCEICNVRFTDENLWDKHIVGAGQSRHSRIAKTRANKVIEYECTTCNTIIYGDEVSLIRHKTKTSKRSQETKLPEQVKRFFKSREELENQAELLAKEANTETSMDRTTTCCNKIEAVLRTSFESCNAYPFGSRVSGLGNQGSDLDLFIDTGDMYFGRRQQDSIAQCQIVKFVAGLLRKHRGEFEKIHEVPTARTPIVRVKHIGTQLECDLSFKHGLSVENTKFLRLCLDLQPISQKLILLLKKWSEHNKLTEHITTYALAMLAIFYLQMNGYLLSVKKLKELNPTPSQIIDGCETINYTMPLQLMKNHVISYEHSLSRLLKDFFAYYSNFNYSQDTVCPLLGYTIKRKLFQDPTLLPREMESYVRQLRGPEPETFRSLSPFCIQDPFDLSHNLTKACQENTLTLFKKLCQLSYQQLESF